MSSFRFETPAPKKTSTANLAKYEKEIAALKANPMLWALLEEDAHTSLAEDVKSGRLGFTPKGMFEATTRSNGMKKPDGTRSNKAKIYVRYVGL